MGGSVTGLLRRLTTVAAMAVMLAGGVLSALPAGFPAFLAGRALQGAGLGLVPLATAVARDDLPADRSRSVIVLIGGVTTAAGIGIGYPLSACSPSSSGSARCSGSRPGQRPGRGAGGAAAQPGPASPVDGACAVLLVPGSLGLLSCSARGEPGAGRRPPRSPGRLSPPHCWPAGRAGSCAPGTR